MGRAQGYFGCWDRADAHRIAARAQIRRLLSEIEDRQGQLKEARKVYRQLLKDLKRNRYAPSLARTKHS